jgi:DnaJ family protein A protein 2
MSDDLYVRLGIGREATDDEIKRAYKKAVLTAHPDKPGGSKEKFQAVHEAFKVLSDPVARAEYDRTGHIPGGGDGDAGEMAAPPDLSEILGSIFGGGFGVPGGFPIPMMFGGGGGPGGMGGNGRVVLRRAQGPNKVHEIGVTLADLWAGKAFTLNMKREVLCGGCSGRGGTEFRACGGCAGRGFRIVRQQMGPMLVASQEPCGDCRGEGQIIDVSCLECGGRRVVEATKALEVRIEPGMSEGDRIVFPEACSESPEFERPGDVVLVLRAATGSDAGTWIRRGSSLVKEVTLDVAESLLGWERLLEEHPSGAAVPVVWEGGVVRDGEVLRVPGWGMPLRSNGDSACTMPERSGGTAKGDLLLVCRVAAPEGPLSEEQQRALQSVWPEWRKPGSIVGAHRLERSRGEAH